MQMFASTLVLGLFSLALQSCTNPFDPTNSTQRAADERLLFGMPEPGKIPPKSRLELSPSDYGMNQVALWLNGKELHEENVKPDSPCFPVDNGDGRWVCWLNETTLIEYQFSVGSVESKGIGPKRLLGTYTIE